MNCLHESRTFQVVAESSASSWALIVTQRRRVDSPLSSTYARQDRISAQKIGTYSSTLHRFYTHEEAVDCMRFVSGTKLDERVIRCDLDPGYRDGRQYGRGRSGGQVRDEYRQEYDAGRGGWGHNRLREEEEKKRQEDAQQRERERHERREEVYQEAQGTADAHKAPVGADAEYYETEHAERAGHATDEMTRDSGATKRQRDDDPDEQAGETGERHLDAGDAKNPRIESS